MQSVTVVVPDGMVAGQQMQVDPDGPQGPLPPVLVTVRAPSHTLLETTGRLPPLRSHLRTPSEPTDLQRLRWLTRG